MAGAVKGDRVKGRLLTFFWVVRPNPIDDCSYRAAARLVGQQKQFSAVKGQRLSKGVGAKLLLNQHST